MCKVYLCKDRGETWRVRVVDTETRKKKSYLFATESEARGAMPGIQRAYRRPIGVKMSKALEEYGEHLATRGNRPGRPNRPRTIETTLGRLGKVFHSEILTGELTPAMVRALWDAFKAGKAVDTLLNTLAQAKTFFRWMKARGWLKHPEALDGIEVLGRRKRGKPQLTEDESKRFLECALGLGRAGDVGAVAAVTALVLGMRGSEIAERIVRDLDAGGTKLRITSAKTAAGVRTMKVPPVLQPLLKALAEGSGSGRSNVRCREPALGAALGEAHLRHGGSTFGACPRPTGHARQVGRGGRNQRGRRGRESWTRVLRDYYRELRRRGCSRQRRRRSCHGRSELNQLVRSWSAKPPEPRPRCSGRASA